MAHGETRHQRMHRRSLFEVDGRLQRLVGIGLEPLALVGDERRDLDERALVAAHRGTRGEQPAPAELRVEGARGVGRVVTLPLHNRYITVT